MAQKRTLEDRYQEYLDSNQFIGKQDYMVRKLKPLFISEQNGKCAICGMPQEWNGKPLTINIYT